MGSLFNRKFTGGADAAHKGSPSSALAGFESAKGCKGYQEGQKQNPGE
ncbi:hypothetical protein HYR99_40125 [Candidatus Poribacteria bacterium]|nr:hypothetical protein [Candidatus Poribacteria bacterium]